jgi:hypothetical protein
MASTVPTDVGLELSFINTTPKNFSQNADNSLRDEDVDMHSAPSESDGLEYNSPTPNNNIPHQGSHSQHTEDSSNTPGNNIYANGVPRGGWDGSSFNTALKIQAQELLAHMREVLQWADTFSFMYPRQVDNLLQPIYSHYAKMSYNYRQADLDQLIVNT